MKNKTNKIDWIIAECCSEADGAELRRFFGSEAEVRMLLLQLVRESRENDPDSYDNGTESEEEVGSYCSGWLNAYASFSSYHVDFTAVLFANMKSIKRNPVVRYVAKNIKWDTDGDQESFDSLPQEVILPAKFSKENYKDENGIFGKAEKIEMLDDISDWLSNGYGFCNNGFELTQKEVRKYDLIAIEDLDMAAMKKSLKLGKSVSDVGWGKFTQILEELCNKFGKLLIRVGRWYPSSKTCSHCGSIDKDLKLNDRVYECSECGHTMNRDKNAAVNILEEAFRILEENMFRPSVEGYKKPALISTIA